MSWTQELDEATILATKSGWWHIVLFYLLCGLSAIPTSFLVFSQVFTNATPEHWCSPPPELEGIGEQLYRNLTVPGKHGVQAGCIAHSVDSKEFFHTVQRLSNGTQGKQIDEIGQLRNVSESVIIEAILTVRSVEPKECQHGWKFSSQLYKRTLVTENLLVCDKDWLPRMSNTLFWVGSIFGNFFFGWMSDRYGRRPTILLMIFIEVPLSIATSFPGNYWVYVALRIVCGLFFPALYQLPFILALELMPPAKRTNAGILVSMLFATGMCLLSTIAYFIRDWFHLSLATTLPFVSLYGYFWILPESPRWLVGRGRIADAEKVLRNIAKKNGITLERGFLLQLHKKVKDEENEEKLLFDTNGFPPNAETRISNMIYKTNIIKVPDSNTEKCDPHTVKDNNDDKRGDSDAVNESQVIEIRNISQTDPTLKLQMSTLRRKSIQFVNRIISNEDDDDLIENKIMDDQNSEGDCKASPLDVFRYPNIRKKFLLLTFNITTLGIAYNGLSFNTPNLGVDDYLAFFIGGAVELPAYIIAGRCIQRYGRRWVFYSFMTLGGFACVCCALVPEAPTVSDCPWVTVSLAMLGRLSAAAAFAVFYVQIGELLPTVLRAQAMGAASFIAGIGTLACPYIVYSAVIFKSLPLIIIGVLSMMAGFGSLWLPETLNRPLPQTLGDGELFGRNFKILSCALTDDDTL